MSITDLPSNSNMLNPANHRFSIFRLPVTEFFVQKVILPSMTLPDITTGNPFNRLNYASSSVEFGKLSLVFKVDEDLRNYVEISNWMKGLGFPESFTEYKELKKNSDGKGGIRSDASLLITQSNNVANKEIIFRDIFPISLDNLVFDTTLDNVPYITATAIFSVRDFMVSSSAL